MSKGTKHDAGKVPVGLLPWPALKEIAKVLDFGRKKYSAHNWRGGFLWSRLYDACQRHLWAWNEGEDKDPETGLTHLAHAGCCIMFLLTHELLGLGEDDRYRPDKVDNAEDELGGNPPKDGVKVVDAEYVEEDGSLNSEVSPHMRKGCGEECCDRNVDRKPCDCRKP